MSVADRPNILLLCTDQQRWDTLGCYGCAHVDTPNLDRLASEGALFERCYVQSPVCAPSRASLLTGMYPHAHGLWANGVPLPRHLPLVSRALADAGYDCGLIGKLHLGACEGGRTEPRLDDGFRLFEWTHGPAHRSPANSYHRWLRRHHADLYEQAVTGTVAGARNIGTPFKTMPEEAHFTHWAAESAIEFLRTGWERSRPFFLVVNFFDPHHPFGAPEPWWDRYLAADLPGPSWAEGELARRPPVLAHASQRSYAGDAPGFCEYSEEDVRRIRAAYYAMVAFVDHEVGRILTELTATDEESRTLVLFTSDHGEMLGDHQLLLKGPMMYEGAVRVPLLMRWPGMVPAGARRPELVQWLDLTSTLTDAAGVEPLATAQGQSLLPLARRDASGARAWALCEYRDSGHPYHPAVHVTMLRTGDHKLVLWHGMPATPREADGELYDLRRDPHELRNLYHEPAHQSVRAVLERMLLDVLVATEDRSAVREARW